MPKIYAEIAVKVYWFWINNRHMVAVETSSPKAVVVMLVGGWVQV